ncbi:hypothetical protein [Paenibacillus alvei]|uniref:hypothetical protein n=1 Tax=Paenibacillus alvei TaxID=44250 RepID=UPI0013D9A691|nr:hypothetical protein [Paenibacillus alvei]
MTSACTTDDEKLQALVDKKVEEKMGEIQRKFESTIAFEVNTQFQTLKAKEAKKEQEKAQEEKDKNKLKLETQKSL